MKQVFNILIVLLLCLPTFVLAQNNENPVCGTEFTPEMKARLIENIETAKSLNLSSSSSRTTQYIKVKFHLVANNDGTGRISQAKVFEALCALNQNFADQDVIFYLEGIYEMDNTIVNTHSNPAGAAVQMSIRKNQHNNAMNVFVCSSVNSGSGTPGTTLGYYSPNHDILVLRSNQINATSVTFTHEAGHFFSLPHPFLGWESTDYHANYSASNPPPTTVMWGNTTHNVELADGSNCATAGDLFCDTQADYNLGFGWGNCNYSNGAVDPTGALVDPDETLYMGYFLDGNCQNTFSTEQKGAVAADIARFGRSYLRGTPSTTVQVASVANLTAPANNATTQFYDEVFLNWDAVADANQYYIEVNRFQNFSLNGKIDEVMVTNNSYLLTGLSANTTYYWRVKAFNEVSSCAGFSSTRQFRTSSFPVSTSGKLKTTEIKLEPNFASEGQIVNLNIQTKEKIDATIRIINLNGQILKDENLTLQSGTHIHSVSTEGLSSGVYIVNLQTAKGQINERLVITN
ncbi:MAG: T9SS type A sorting domain-containing protein [Saprospiraceae bacterium]